MKVRTAAGSRRPSTRDPAGRASAADREDRDPKHKVLGSGTYGCTVSPYVPCAHAIDEDDLRHKLVPDRRYVSKLLGSSSEMAIEFEKNNAVRRLDPNGVFTVPIVKACYTKLDKSIFLGPEFDREGRERYPQKCKHAAANLETEYQRVGFTKARGELPQLVYEHGGMNLEKAVRANPLHVLLASLTPILSGLASIQEAGVDFFHRDIKPANIVFRNGASRLIDFGNSVTAANDLFDGYVAQNPYEFWPPEGDLLYKLMYHEDRPEGLNADRGKKRYIFPFSKVSAPSRQSPDFQYAEMAAKVLEDLGERPSRAGIQSYYTRHFKYKFDIYSMGIVVMFLSLNVPEVYSDLSPDTARLVRNWVYHVTNYNAFQRWDAVRALREWLTIWPVSTLEPVEEAVVADLPPAVQCAPLPDSPELPPRGTCRRLGSSIWSRFSSFLFGSSAKLGGAAKKRRRSVSLLRRQKRKSRSHSKRPRKK